MRTQVALLVSAIFQVVLFALASDAVQAAEEPAPPQEQTLQVNGVSYSLEVEIAAGAAGDEALAHGVYLFRLKCSADLVCSFQRLTLNECTAAKDGTSTFTPRADLWTTSTGQLSVRQIGRNDVELTVYQAFGKKLPAKVLLTFASGPMHPFQELANLKTTGFIDLRAWPDINRTIDYIAVQKDQTKALDCPISLRGLKR